MTALASTPEEFLQLLRSRHAAILGGRADKRPGFFKEAANRAGDSLFVLPGLVAGTLRAGWEHLAELDTAFERAVYVILLHPGAGDGLPPGNERLQRARRCGATPNAGQPGPAWLTDRLMIVFPVPGDRLLDTCRPRDPLAGTGRCRAPGALRAR